MMARPYSVVVALWLLAGFSRFGEGASHPGFVARITRKGLEYAGQYGVAVLKKELSTITLPDFSGDYMAGWIGSVSYEFHSLKIRHFRLGNADLSLLPEQGTRVRLSNNHVSVTGGWKATKAFINFVGYVSIDISGSLSWILNLFHERIENTIKSILEQEVCKEVRKSAASYLEPYLRTLPVTTVIDQFAGIDYSLVGAPEVTSEGLDTPFKGEFFSLSQRSAVPFDAPAIRLPQQHERMLYFAVSEYVFNTASLVYHRARPMRIVIRTENVKKLANNKSARKWRKQNLYPSCLTANSTTLSTLVSCFSGNFLLLLLQLPPDSPTYLHTNAFRALVPQLARLHPDMEVELEASPASEPFLTFTPGNVTFMPVVDIRAFALQPNSSDRKPLFQLRAKTNISATINVSSGRIFGSVASGSKLKLELKHSSISHFNVELMEAVFNYYALKTIFPSLNAKLEKGFSLPLPRDTALGSLEFQIHKVSEKWGLSEGL
ncbi:lipopolysaccharide-binding protein-like [Lepus europaeus]|uniref:lipopolysaccharide-binding protein-like n=1 Tax=Lepus europaeus TaxID=9983 RepID=UPI002B4901C8|nr:lipopolysaccharide-binding protein-like [Lepus europaeus]